MRRRVAVATILILFLGASMSQGYWKMRVHEGETTTEFSVSEIDSLTFYSSLTPDMVVVPAGSFIMGDGVALNGTDEHEVTLTHDFYLGRREVTNQEYLEAVQWAYDNGHVTATSHGVWDVLDGSTATLMNLGGSTCEIQFDSLTESFYLRESPSSEAQNAYPDGYDPADHPAKMVTWYGAARYCDWLSLREGLPRAYEHSGDWSCNSHAPYDAAGYRLPTDAEREYASQYNDERIYPWGDQVPDCNRGNFYIYDGSGYFCVGWTSPVASYQDAPLSLGSSDMAGNMWEWCNDWFLSYLGTAPVTDPVGPTSGDTRVLRGGTWDIHVIADCMRCALRISSLPASSNDNFGFRVAKTAGP